MLDELKTEWQTLKRAGVGRRFAEHHERYEERGAPGWKALHFFATIFVSGMAVTLPFVAGYALHALPFAALAVVLLPGESRTFARLLDRLEATLRRKAQPVPARPPARTTTQLDRAELELALRAVTANDAPRPAADRPVVPTQPMAAPAPVTSVRAVQPITVTDRPAPAVTRAKIIPRPRIAGTMKIWSTGDAAAEPGPKVTIVVFPPRAEAERLSKRTP